MGIIGLKKYLSHQDALEADFVQYYVAENVPYGSHLNIDANGWLFHIMDSEGGKKILRQYGGSYTQLDSLIKKEIQDLKSVGFTICFFFDGRNSSMKEETKGERDIKRADSWWAILDAVSEDPDLNQSHLDLPTLSMQQFAYTIKASGAKIVLCEFEADQEIARACKNADDDRSHYCYGNDT